ncbi:MAG: hypothetical protein FJZ01_26745 [Candidatus Sericytochromatia bacterium]|nr:hypothetical protein [Candidatus Tanganyikabacteria bacterium]
MIKDPRGFTLVEATLTAAVLMVGVISLIKIGQTSVNQIREIRRDLGQPAIAERLIHDQLEALMAEPAPPAAAPRIPPLGIDGVVYEIRPTTAACSACPNVTGMTCYSFQVYFNNQPYKAGPYDAPCVYAWRR